MCKRPVALFPHLILNIRAPLGRNNACHRARAAPTSEAPARNIGRNFPSLVRHICGLTNSPRGHKRLPYRDGHMTRVAVPDRVLTGASGLPARAPQISFRPSVKSVVSLASNLVGGGHKTKHNRGLAGERSGSLLSQINYATVEPLVVIFCYPPTRVIVYQFSTRTTCPRCCSSRRGCHYRRKRLFQ